jgi:hypothetical protein
MANREYIIRINDAELEFSWSGSERSHQINIRYIGESGILNIMTMNQGKPATFAMFEDCVNDWLKDNGYNTD